MNKYLSHRKDERLAILDVGSFNANGTLKPLFFDRCIICTVCGASSSKPLGWCCPRQRPEEDLVCDGEKFRKRKARGSSLWRYCGLDVRKVCAPHAPLERFPLRYNVDRFYDPPEAFPVPDEAADVIVSTSCLEHDPAVWVTFGEMVRVLKPGGLMYLNVPGAGPHHGYPMDCWRFTRDTYKALIMPHQNKMKLLETIELDSNESGGWNDMIGIVEKIKE